MTIKLKKAHHSGWHLNDCPGVYLQKVGKRCWMVDAYGADKQRLEQAGFPLREYLLISQREVAQQLVSILGCTSSLRQNPHEYMIGDTGYSVYQHLSSWHIRKYPENCNPPSNQYTYAIQCVIAVDHEYQRRMKFKTRAEALRRFQQWYDQAAAQHNC